jgi:hypothetical protein
LILLIIPVVALVIDQALFWIQRELFPHRYGGAGILNAGVRAVLHAWEDLKNWLWRLFLGSESTPPANAAPTERNAP